MSNEELFVRVFVADEVRISPSNEDWWANTYGILSEPFYMKENEDYYVLKFETNDIGVIAYLGDLLLMKHYNWRNNRVVSQVWFRVTSIVEHPNNQSLYVLKRIAGDKFSSDISAGTTFVNFGKQNQSYIQLETLEL